MIVAPSAAVPGRTAASSGVALGVDGSADAREDAGGQPREGGVQQRLQRAVAGPRAAGVGRAGAVDAAPQRVRAQHHLGMRREIRVDRDGARAVRGSREGWASGRRPVRCLRRSASSAASAGGSSSAISARSIQGCAARLPGPRRGAETPARRSRRRCRRSRACCIRAGARRRSGRPCRRCARARRCSPCPWCRCW